MSAEINSAYDAFYKSRNPVHVYPPEFVVRAFLGTYPRLAGAKPDFVGKRILDLGFGDGRTIPLLANLGMDICGAEIAEDICTRTRDRMLALGIKTDLRVGRNNSLPFDDVYFDHVMACHACYYVDAGSSFADNVREIHRVTRPGGWFVFSVPIGSSYIFKGAKDIGDGHMEIANDPYGIRNGYVLKKFDSAEEIARALSGLFTSVRTGACRNDFWGIEEHVWIVVCERNP